MSFVPFFFELKNSKTSSVESSLSHPNPYCQPKTQYTVGVNYPKQWAFGIPFLDGANSMSNKCDRLTETTCFSGTLGKLGG
jgi:hypothetical protein